MKKVFSIILGMLLLCLISFLMSLFYIKVFEEKPIVLPFVEVPYQIEEEITPPTNVFHYGEIITGTPREILFGIAMTESELNPNAIGDKNVGCSYGMFQLYEPYKESRIEKWGEFDPFIPKQAVIICGEIMQDNFKSFPNDLELSIGAYRQGINGVRKNGLQLVYGSYCYAEKVLENAKLYEEKSYGFM